MKPAATAAQRPPEHDVEQRRESTAVATIASAAETSMGRPSGRVREVRRERAEGHHVAVGEVDEPQDPVDERDADGGDRDHRAGDEAVREQLREHGSDHLRLGDGSSLGEASTVEDVEHRIALAGDTARRRSARRPARS